MFYREVVPRFFLNSYHPLLRGPAPYIDASCRREPDFEARWPTITALCRRRKFAPRLNVGDRVAYMTVKVSGGWRLVALLEVEHRFETHELAAEWYRRHRERLPSNLMVDGNPPHPLEDTNRCGPCANPAAALREWDEEYRERAEECGVVLACRPLFLDLHAPPAISREDWITWIEKTPLTRAGLQIDEALWRHLERRARQG